MDSLILNIVFSAVFGCIIVFFYSHLFSFRLPGKSFLFIPIAFITVAATAVSEIFADNMLLNFIFIFAILLLGICFFKCKWRGILYACVLEASILVADSFVFYSIYFVLGEEAFSISFVVVSSRIVMYLLISIGAFVLARRLKTIQHHDIPVSYWIMLIMVPLSSIFWMYSIISLYFKENIMLFESWISLAIIFFMIIISVIIYTNIVEYFNVKLQNQSLSSRVEAFTWKQSALAESSRKIRAESHNLRNNLHPILTAIDSREYHTARNKLIKILGDISDIRDVAYTGIECIDDMLNYKIWLGKEYGISFDIDCELESEPIIPEMDISTAIGIAIDNAIEACQADGVPKDIHIEITCRIGLFRIVINNSFANELLRNDEGKFLTTKLDSENHGFGIESIQNIVVKCDGKLRIKAENNIFTLEMLYEVKSELTV